MILLPSDTCYSLAAIPARIGVYESINEILNRGKMPMSLAFPNFHAVETYVEVNITIANLLEKFTPGAITVICHATSNISTNFGSFVKDIVNSTDGTIGVRIPDSLIEREIAGCTRYPITTVAVRDESGEIIQHFDQAREIVQSGMKKVGLSNWAAVEGKNFLPQHSTVVRVNYSTNQISVLRNGEISEEDIRSIRNRMPQWYLDEKS